MIIYGKNVRNSGSKVNTSYLNATIWILDMTLQFSTAKRDIFLGRVFV